MRTLRLRFAPKFKKMCGLKLDYPQAQPNCTRSYKKKKKECTPCPCKRLRAGSHEQHKTPPPPPGVTNASITTHMQTKVRRKKWYKFFALVLAFDACKPGQYKHFSFFLHLACTCVCLCLCKQVEQDFSAFSIQWKATPEP